MIKETRVEFETRLRRQVLDEYDRRYHEPYDIETKTARELWIDIRWLIDRLREARVVLDDTAEKGLGKP